MRVTLDLAPRADSIYVSPHPDDVALSCAGRLLDDLSQGRRTLVVTLFDAPSEQRAAEEAAAAVELGTDHLLGGLLDAPFRRAGAGRMADILFGRIDSPALDEATSILAATLERTGAQELVLPLGIGGHVDHRIAHLAGCRAAGRRPSLRVSFYEDRPYAFIAESLRLRLAALRLRGLGPELAAKPRPSILLACLASARRFNCIGAGLRPRRRELPRVLWELLRQARACGGRPDAALRPETGAWQVAPDRLKGILACHGSQFPAILGSLDNYLACASSYAARLGHEGLHAERWWIPEPGAIASLGTER